MNMTNGVRNHAGDKTQAELIALGEELAGNLDQQRALAAREVEIKARIRQLIARYALPVQDGPSEYLNLPTLNKALQVTHPAPAVSIGDPERLLQRIGCDAFHQACRIKTVEFLADAWTVMEQREEVKPADLDGVVVVRENAPRIGFAKAQKGS